jgi:hypothetical protein
VSIAIESLCILAGMIPLTTEYLRSGLFPFALICFVVGLLWLALQMRHWAWLAQMGMFVFTVAAGAGIWLGFSPFLMALSVLGSLFAWDLDHANRRLQSADLEDDRQGLQKTHLVWVAVLASICMALLLAALLINMQISFGWVFLLAFAAVLGLLQLIRRYHS